MEPGPHVEEMEAAIRADGEGLRALRRVRVAVEARQERRQRGPDGAARLRLVGPDGLGDLPHRGAVEVLGEQVENRRHQV